MVERSTYLAGAAGGALVVLALFVFAFVIPVDWVVALVAQLDTGLLSAALRLSVPIAFAALGGIFAEKSGVINIGLEGLLIASAFTSIAVAWALEGRVAPATAAWSGFAAAVLSSTLLAGLFAVVTIRYEADQIIAGLAVWLVALGFAPFASQIIWESVNSPGVPTLGNWVVPRLVDVPVLGPAVFDSNPTVYLMLVAVPVSWYLLNRTAFGRWVRASGENPKALDTAGVNVTRVRYASVLLSGVFSGIGGAGLALGQVGQFIGSGQTMVSGRGWIGITAYLMGNYNPIGAFLSSFLFAGLNALQFRVQQIAELNIAPSLVQMVPFVAVIVVLALVGKTRIPDAAGDHYESGDD
jgi:simple sugar transport system permease protein